MIWISSCSCYQVAGNDAVRLMPVFNSRCEMKPYIMSAKRKICFIGLHCSPDRDSREVLWTVITEEGRAQLAYALDVIEI